MCVGGGGGGGGVKVGSVSRCVDLAYSSPVQQ